MGFPSVSRHSSSQLHLPQKKKVRDWSLITGRWGPTKRDGVREVLPLRKGGGAEKTLAMLKGGGGGGTTSFGIVFTHQLEVLAILKGGGTKRFPLCKTSGAKSCTLS